MKAIMNTEYKTFLEEIKDRLLEGHYAERGSQIFGKREVILSMYLAGDE